MGNPTVGGDARPARVTVAVARYALLTHGLSCRIALPTAGLRESLFIDTCRVLHLRKSSPVSREGWLLVERVGLAVRWGRVCNLECIPPDACGGRSSPSRALRGAPC